MRYDAVAIALHWLIALAILVNIAIGLWMHGAIEEVSTQAAAVKAYQLHKSIGLTVLMLSLARLAWRLLHPPPGLPLHMPRWSRRVAGLTHWGFYGLMVGIPLTGWLYVSLQWRDGAALNVPTLWFGLFEVPHLFGLNEVAGTARGSLAEALGETHEWLAFGLLGLLALHVAAALKHQWLEKDGVLARMLPFLPAASPEVTPSAQPKRLAVVILLGGAVLFLYSGMNGALLSRGGDAAGAGLQQALQTMVAGQDVQATPWPVDMAQSRIEFTGSHVSNPFIGRFTEWLADIRFDPGDLAGSRILAVIATASATDGVALHDRTLPEREWFDVGNHPFARYRSTGIRQAGSQQYEIDGVLVIKEHEVPIPALMLTLDDQSLRLSGEVKLDRGDVDMGMESDPQGQYVSRTIGIHVEVTALAGE